MALKLGEHKTTEEQKEVSISPDLPPQRGDICTITALDGPLPSLNISTVAVPAGIRMNTPSCSWHPLSVGDLGVCTGFVRGNSVTFVLITKGPSDAATKGTFRSLVERVSDELAGPDAHGTVIK